MRNNKNEDILYYSYPQIVYREVPDEIALALMISGCHLRCKGCHSSFTWDPKYGEPLTYDTLRNLIKKNKYITAVLFYGGEWKEQYLLKLFDIVKNEFNLKVTLYTGLEWDMVSNKIKENVDILKVGPYINELGGLDRKTTNQKIFRKTNNNNWEEIKLTWQI